MVPKLVGKVGCISEERVEVTHNGDDRLGLSCSLCTILDKEQRVDHLVNVASVLRQIELAARKIVIMSHNCFGLSDTPYGRG